MDTRPGSWTTMLTNTTTATQKVVIVNGSHEMLGLLETVLEAGHYDVVMVESSSHAYTQIKRVQPNLVILCLSAADVEGYQVLSMLTLDPATRDIPVLTYSTEFDGQEFEDDASEVSETAMLAAAQQAVRMN